MDGELGQLVQVIELLLSSCSSLTLRFVQLILSLSSPSTPPLELAAIQHQLQQVRLYHT